MRLFFLFVAAVVSVFCSSPVKAEVPPITPIAQLMAKNEPEFTKTRANGEKLSLYVETWPYQMTEEDWIIKKKAEAVGGLGGIKTKFVRQTCVMAIKGVPETLFYLEGHGSGWLKILDAVIVGKQGYIIYSSWGVVRFLSFKVGAQISHYQLAKGDYVENVEYEAGLNQVNACITVNAQTVYVELEHDANADSDLYNYYRRIGLSVGKTGYTMRKDDKARTWVPDFDTECLFLSHPELKSKLRRSADEIRVN